MSSTPPQQQEGSQRPLRLLLLDAGGVHSLSTIRILKRMMNDLNETLAPEEKVEPWQIFDMIGGAETGGLIAIMLGCLRMSLDDCEEAFRDVCEKIYRPKDPNDQRRNPAHWQYIPSKFDSEVLAETVKDMIRKNIPIGEDPEEVLVKDLETSCKVVVPLVEHMSDSYRIITSYERTKVLNPEIEYPLYTTLKLWEACAATTASEGLFDPVKIAGGLKEGFYYPSLMWDDPIYLVAYLLKEQWLGRDTLMISIGSGIFTEKRSGFMVAKIFENNSDLVRADMRFRFNHDTMLKDFLKEDSDKFDHILNSATAYMDDDKFKGELKACVGKLRQTYQMTSSASNR